MSDDEKESSGLGFLLALGGATAAIYTAYKVFIKPDSEQFEINNIAKSVESEVSILIPAHFEDATSTIREAREQHHLTNFDVLALEDKGHESDKPQSWTIKAWGCQRIAFKATGDYLVFIEPGIKLTPDAVALSINCLQENNLDAVLIQPTILNKTEPAVIANFLLSLPTPLNENDGTEIDAAFLVITRNAYSAMAGHTRVANEKFEGGAWVKELTATGFRVGVVDGSGVGSKMASVEIPELDEDLAVRVGTFLGTYLLPVVAIIGGRSSFKQLLGSLGLIANIATVIKSRRIR
jgi:hypothetical protein